MLRVCVWAARLEEEEEEGKKRDLSRLGPVREEGERAES